MKMGMAAAEAQFHVLAVDDSLVDRKLIERLLKTSSYQVTTVDSGSKALEFLGWHDDHTPDISLKNHPQREVEVNLVITDYCMPGMTGYDLLKKMKESSLLRNIPVVIMSSENVPSRINRCLEEGAEKFLLKPVRLSDVNKLKPHIIKTKVNEFLSVQKEEKQEEQKQSQQLQLQPELQSQPSQQLSQSSSGNKRKSTAIDEEEVSPDKTRSRYNDGLTVMSS